MVEHLFAHFSGVAAVNSEHKLNVITRLTTKWVDNFGDNSIVKGGNFHYSTYLPSSPKQYLPSSQPTWHCQRPRIRSTDHANSYTLGGSLSHTEYGLDKELDRYHTNYCQHRWHELHGLCHNVQSYLNLGTKKGNI
jgi:hypothetical protein